MKDKTKILFVCLGNICRSPAAEGIMARKIKEAGLDNRIEVDSAGTYGGHSGEKADPRMRAAASKRGYDLTSRSRQIHTEDFWESDLIIVMDDSNLQNTRNIAPDPHSQEKIHRMVEYCAHHTIDHVPDPYYEGAEGFETVLDILEDACDGLLNKIRAELK